MKPDKIFLSLSLVIILAVISWITSCTHQTDTSNIPEICFNTVHTIIRSKCSMDGSGCHQVGGESIPLISYEDIRDAVVPYNADKSTLYKAITSVRGENQMPPDNPLSEESRSKIRFWIEQGAVDSTENSSACSSSKGTGGRNGTSLYYNK